MLSLTKYEGLGPIKFGRNHRAVPAKLVTPLYLDKLEKILRADGSPREIPIGDSA